MGIHDNHRDRMKERFFQNGLDIFDEHQILELLLFYALPRVDTNPIAHALIDRFGSLAGVFDAPIHEIMKIKGIGKHAALLISFIPQVTRRYAMSRVSFDDILDTTDKAGKYLIPRFYGQKEEILILTCLDAKCKVLSCREIERGSINSAIISIRKVVEQALASGATGVILAHNHTSGIAVPSKEDKVTTIKIAEALHSVDILLIDHIVVADDDFVSMADSGFFK